MFMKLDTVLKQVVIQCVKVLSAFVLKDGEHVNTLGTIASLQANDLTLNTSSMEQKC
jgi:hypothetical protein